MFLLNGQQLQEGTVFKDADGVTYPPNWLNQSTEEQKAAIGITWVPDPVRADEQFYWDGDINNPRDLTILKPQFISQMKYIAGQLLSHTDWVIIRKAERNIDIPSSISEYRAAVVAEVDRLETAINAAENIEDFITVIQTPNWPA
jgi:hypothetical protein